VETVGITAGASTPPEAVEAVRQRLVELAAEQS
jgi:4-hydroxy-3-methylbut-2-enyl diphosphate reductase IspH